MTAMPAWLRDWQQTHEDALLDAAPSRTPDVPLPVACYDHQRQCWVLRRSWTAPRETEPLYTPEALDAAQEPHVPQEYWLPLRPRPRRLTLHWPADAEEDIPL